jgi:ABC-type multidrug transport system permease subunit
MSTETTTQPAAGVNQRRYWPLGQLVLARIREFYREPEAVFWVYGFPIMTVVALGIAFRNRPPEQTRFDLDRDRPGAAAIASALAADSNFVITENSEADWKRRLRTGKTDLVVVPKSEDGKAYQLWFDDTRPESRLARAAVDDALQRAAGRSDVAEAKDVQFKEPGARYVDFLVPGLLGMSLMGGGLWGVGFVITDMRIRKLLKRFLATPMKRTDFLTGIMVSRLVFLIPEVLALLVFSRLAFGVVVQGSFGAMAVLILLGAVAFAGIGLLVASRAKTIEAVSGLMNLVMLPMWVLSGIFFSSERFPEIVQPLIKALPLTLLINALRAVALEGATLASQIVPIAGLAAWGLGTFFLALKWFRWD